jgi:hypothetical protein
MNNDSFLQQILLFQTRNSISKHIMSYGAVQQRSTPRWVRPPFFLSPTTPSSSQHFRTSVSSDDEPQACDVCEDDFNALMNENAELTDYVLDLEAQLSRTKGSGFRIPPCKMLACVLLFILALLLSGATYVLESQSGRTTALCVVIWLGSDEWK